jgi:hypothetical protein
MRGVTNIQIHVRDREVGIQEEFLRALQTQTCEEMVRSIAGDFLEDSNEMEFARRGKFRQIVESEVCVQVGAHVSYDTLHDERMGFDRFASMCARGRGKFSPLLERSGMPGVLTLSA